MPESIDDVIIVGSGFAGSVTASRLTSAGVKITLLERGPWRDTLPVRSMGIEQYSPLPTGFGFYKNIARSIHLPFLPKKGVTLNNKGLYEFFLNRHLSVICSSSVGGGSHVYTALHERPANPQYWDNIDDSIDSKTMELHYKKVLKELGSVNPLLKHQIPNHTRSLYKDSSLLTAEGVTQRSSMGMLFPKEVNNPKKTTKNGIIRHEATMTGDGILGSPTGAKTSVDFLYLGKAINKGLMIQDLCEVEAIYQVENAHQARYRVEYFNHRTRQRMARYCQNIILAAGTVNTLKLLLNSRDTAKGLSGMPSLGKGFGSNGDTMAYWSLNNKKTDFSKGTPSHGGITIKDYPSSPQFLQVGLTDIDRIPLPGLLKRRLKRDVFLVGMGEDSADGMVTLKNGRFHIDYNTENSPIYSFTQQSYQKIREELSTPVYGTGFPVTVHPLGGARLGANIQCGVINADGEVFDNPGIYVADAAALPASLGAPPSLTISAWASHLSERFLRKHGEIETSKKRLKTTDEIVSA